MCAWLKNWKLKTFQLITSTLHRQHLKIIIICLLKIERILARSLTSTTIASTNIPNSTAMFHNRQVAKIIFNEEAAVYLSEELRIARNQLSI
jgi:hypothetical protein